jgi:hypothetical protein
MPVSCEYQPGIEEQDTEPVPLCLAAICTTPSARLNSRQAFLFREISMIKVQIITTCHHCTGEAYFPEG